MNKYSTESESNIENQKQCSTSELMKNEKNSQRAQLGLHVAGPLHRLVTHRRPRDEGAPALAATPASLYNRFLTLLY